MGRRLKTWTAEEDSMKITAMEEYGLRCLLRVAEQGDDGAIPAPTIAEQEGLSLSYTQKILRVLTKGGLVDSRRGVQGGYFLARSAEEITVGDAIRVLGGMFQVEEICERHTGELEACARRCNCRIRPVWAHISSFVVATLDGISLAVLMNDATAVARHLEECLPTFEESALSASSA
jgi:Rrf2 family transcriptional regulator, iron-sulfur cluster assembly transcription factor